MTVLEDRLRDALEAGTAAVEESPDLFTRVTLSVAEDRARRHRRRHVLAWWGTSLAALTIGVTTWIIRSEGEPRMDWWIFELIVAGVLVAMALWLGPFIKRFGKSYAADVFRSNPGTGKSFIVLTDFVYYLIFGAYILLTTHFEPDTGWSDTVNADQISASVVRIGGILLIIGLMHGANLLILPVIGRLLTLNRRLDIAMREITDRQLAEGPGHGSLDEGWRDPDHLE